MPDSLDLRIGEERPVRLPALPGDATWSCDVSGMSSAVEVRKLWAADPYPEDDDSEEEEREPPEAVFMVRAAAPGDADLRFTAPGQETREVHVAVTMESVDRNEEEERR